MVSHKTISMGFAIPHTERRPCSLRDTAVSVSSENTVLPAGAMLDSEAAVFQRDACKEPFRGGYM